MRVLLVAACLGPLFAQDPRRYPAGSPDQGLPRDPTAFAPYHEDGGHALNGIFRLLWLQQGMPAEVAAVLPREARVAWREGWVHAKRAGTESDRRWFGGDGRQLPIDGLVPDDARTLRSLLEGIGPAERAVLVEAPELAVLFQHDLLRAAQRLMDTKQNAELLPVLWRAVRFVALDRAEQARLRDPLRLAVQCSELRERHAGELPAVLGGTSDLAFREVLRRSTRLFDAEKTLLWSRVWLAHPDGEAALAALLPAPDKPDGKATAPTVPIGVRAVLVQGIVAVGADGQAYATPITFDLRTQVLRNRDELCADNATFTHDGIDFRIWQLERQGLRRGDAARFFREIEADDQDLFRDYGTQKHTTYRAQCTLCHRNTGTPEPELGGFPVLRPHAGATFAERGDERLRLAEVQANKLLQRLADLR